MTTLDGVKVGTIISYSSSTVPNGYLACNGQAVSRTTYANLFAVIGTTYGVGDGSTTFNVPDLRGEFLRGTGTNSRTHQGNGGSVGEHQDATGIGAVGVGSDGYVYLNGSGLNKDSSWTDDSKKNNQTSWGKTHSAEKSSVFSSRPTNTAVLFAIKY